MVIRGAPAIGVAAALGIALGMRKSTATGTQKFAAEFYKTCELMAATRPTAVNLFWAIERMKRAFAAAAAGRRVGRADPGSSRSRSGGDSRRRRRELPRDGRVGRRGRAGRRADPDALQRRRAGDGRIRHGAGVIRGAVEAGKRVTVFADETRPFLQGARLTAWELVRDGIETTVITDNMAGR